jgi:hypothetical protein
LAQFNEHIKQAQHNLSFLQKINQNVSDCVDWQVTVCFYTSLHLVNAHLSKFSLQYRKHNDVNYALNYAALSPARLPQDEYLAYTTLQSLSRRSRYLVNQKDDNLTNENAFFTYEKHLTKALKHLDVLLHYFNTLYNLELSIDNLQCSLIKNKQDFKVLAFD